MPRPIITLLTDFGYRDAYVGIMKGVIACRADADLVDLTHGVPPGDISAAAYLLASASPYFPDHTTHLAVVDPGVGTDRAVLAARVGSHTFVAPDNGLLTDVLSAPGTGQPAVVKVARSDLFLPSVSRTFHGRDIFAPIAAALARGAAIDELGDVTDDYVQLDRRPARRVDDGIEGEVVYVDRFGNLVTNILAGQLGRLPRPVIHVAGYRIEGLAESYAATDKGTLMAIIGSTDRLEISISGGNAAVELEAGVGEVVSAER